MDGFAPFTLDARDAVLHSVLGDRQSVLDLVHIIVPIAVLGEFGRIKTCSVLMLVPRQA